MPVFLINLSLAAYVKFYEFEAARWLCVAAVLAAAAALLPLVRESFSRTHLGLSDIWGAPSGERGGEGEEGGWGGRAFARGPPSAARATWDPPDLQGEGAPAVFRHDGASRESCERRASMSESRQRAHGMPRLGGAEGGVARARARTLGVGDVELTEDGVDVPMGVKEVCVFV